MLNSTRGEYWKPSQRKGKGHQENKKGRTQPPQEGHHNRLPTKTQLYYSIKKGKATSLDPCKIKSMEMPWNCSRMTSQEAIKKFSMSIKTSARISMPFKHLEFLSFQMVHTTAGKALHIILPLAKLVCKCHAWNRSPTDLGKIQQQSNHLIRP